MTGRRVGDAQSPGTRSQHSPMCHSPVPSSGLGTSLLGPLGQLVPDGQTVARLSFRVRLRAAGKAGAGSVQPARPS